MTKLLCRFTQKVSDYDQERPQAQTTDPSMAPQGRVTEHRQSCHIVTYILIMICCLICCKETNTIVIIID